VPAPFQDRNSAFYFRKMYSQYNAQVRPRIGETSRGGAQATKTEKPSNPLCFLSNTGLFNKSYRHEPMRLNVPQQSPPVFPTYRIHNPPKYSPCASPDCLYQRNAGEPSDPLLPLYWTAKWRMYRIFKKYTEYPPPYDGAPPSELKEGEDYQTSYGITYYDSTLVGPNGEVGAMMEHYIDWSLPIFPFKNNFSCSFISLGDKAYILR
jgi:hypothetical protein